MDLSEAQTRSTGGGPPAGAALPHRKGRHGSGSRWEARAAASGAQAAAPRPPSGVDLRFRAGVPSRLELAACSPASALCAAGSTGHRVASRCGARVLGAQPLRLESQQRLGVVCSWRCCWSSLAPSVAQLLRRPPSLLDGAEDALLPRLRGASCELCPQRAAALTLQLGLHSCCLVGPPGSVWMRSVSFSSLVSICLA